MAVSNFVAETHYSDVILRAMASPITGVSIVCSTVYSGADQRKHQSSVSQAFMQRLHQWPVDSHHKGPVTWKCIHLMTSSCFKMTDKIPAIVRAFRWLISVPILTLLNTIHELLKSESFSYNSLVPARSGCDVKNAIFTLVLLIGIFRSLYNNAIKRIPIYPTGDQDYFR